MTLGGTRELVALFQDALEREAARSSPARAGGVRAALQATRPLLDALTERIEAMEGEVVASRADASDRDRAPGGARRDAGPGAPGERIP